MRLLAALLALSLTACSDAGGLLIVECILPRDAGADAPTCDPEEAP